MYYNFVTLPVFSYITANDIRAQEEGYLNPNVPEGPGESARGSFSYVAPDGEQFVVTYTADENGFVPEGAHLPTPPPIPPEILESLQKNAADEAAGIYDDGSYREEEAGGGARGGYVASGVRGAYGGSGEAYGAAGLAYGKPAGAYGATGAAYVKPAGAYGIASGTGGGAYGRTGSKGIYSGPGGHIGGKGY